MQVKCGNHGTTTYHNSVAEVKDCYRQAALPQEPSASGAQEDVLRALASTLARPGANDRATLKQVRYVRSLLETREIPQSLQGWADEVANALGSEDLDWGNDGDGNSGMDVPTTLTKRSASVAIDRLTRLGHKQVQVQESPVEAQARLVQAASREAVRRSARVDRDGIYRNPDTGEIFMVQCNRASGDGRRLYAKQMYLEGQTGREVSRGILDVSPAEAARMSIAWSYVPRLIEKINPSWRMTMAEAERFGALYGRCLRCSRVLTKEESISRSMGPVCAGKDNWA